MPTGKSKAFPMPIKAIPMVADVDQLLPVAKETKAEINTHAGKKKRGLAICKP
jgi:hypothetical protein